MEATYGIKIEVKGGDQGAAEARKVETAFRSAHGAVEQGSIKSAGALERMAGSLSRSSNGAMMLLRGLGPLGGSSVRLAEQLERVALRAERMTVSSTNSASGVRILDAAVKQGVISTASMDVAVAKYISTRERATQAESVYAAAQKMQTATLEQSKLAAIAVAAETNRLAQARLTGTNTVQMEREVTRAQIDARNAAIANREATLGLSAARQESANATSRSAEMEKLLSSASASGGGIIQAIERQQTARQALTVATEKATEAQRVETAVRAEADRMIRLQIQSDNLLAQAQRQVEATAINAQRSAALQTKVYADPSSGYRLQQQADKIAGRDKGVAMTAEQELIRIRQQNISVTEQAEGGVRKLSVAEQEAKTATTGLTAAQKELAEANKAAEGTRKVASSGLGITIGVIGGIIVVLAALAAAIFAVKTAWDLLRDSIKTAAEFEKAEFPLKQMIGDAGLAKEKISELHEFAASQGAFKFPELAETAHQLVLLGTGSDNLIPRLKQFAELAVGSGEGMSQMVQGYARTQQAIMNGTELMTRGMGGARVIMLALMDDLKKPMPEIQEMFKRGEISIQMVNKALKDAISEGGRFAGGLEAQAKTWDGATEKLRNQWEELKLAIGKPIIDALTPVITMLTKQLKDSQPLADEVGKRIGHIADTFAQIALQDGWKAALQAAWEIVIDAMATTAITILVGVFSKLGPALADAFWHGYTERIKGIFSGGTGFTPIDAKAFGETLIRDLTSGMSARKPELEAELAKIRASIAAAFAPMGQGAPMFPVTGGYNIGDWSSSRYSQAPKSKFVMQGADFPITPIPKKTKESDWAKYEDDITKINQMWYDMSIIESKVGDETEKNRRINELFGKTAADLYNPAQLDGYLAALQKEHVINADLIIQDAERVRRQKELDTAIKNNTASAWDSMTRGIQKAKEAFGNMDQMVEKMTTDIVNALDNDISAGLTDILNGTKSVSQGFRDMALSIIKDIEAIIIKMMVQLAIQRLLGGLGGGGYTTSGYTGAGLSPGAMGGGYIQSLASGGAAGFTGARPKNAVAGVVHGGEYVFTAEQTKKLGVPFLERLARAAGGTASYQEGGAVRGNPYGIGNPPGSAILPPEAYPGGRAPAGYTTTTGAASGELPPSASGVAPGPAYSDLPLSTGSPAHPFDTMLASIGIVPGGIDIRGDYPSQGGREFSPGFDPATLDQPLSRNRMTFAGRLSGGYPLPGGGRGGPMAGDWARNAAGSPIYIAPQVSTFGSHGISGQGGSYFGGSGTLELPGGGSFSQSGEGRNVFGYFGGSHRVGPMGKATWSGLMKTSGWGQLLYPHGGMPSYREYASSPIWAMARNVPTGRFATSGGAGLYHAGQIIKPKMEGGFVDWPRWHGGGMAPDEMPVVVQKGETILPRGTATNVNSTQVNLSVNFNGDGSRGARMQSGRGGDQESAADLERLVVPVVEKWAAKQKRYGGMLHSSTER